MSGPQLTIVAAPAAFKECLTAPEAARAIARGVRDAVPQAAVIRMPVADGGDGTLDALLSAMSGKPRVSVVAGPYGEPVRARWGTVTVNRRRTAVIEMAEAAGLRVTSVRRPSVATTFGVGQLLLEAAAAGCSQALVGIGGSATNDGGAGMAQALGARLLDRRGADLPRGGAALARLATIDLGGWRLPPDFAVTAACDVRTPLIGPRGASAVFGPQKGAGPEDVAELDAALRTYAGVLRRTFGVGLARTPGGGAAGGLGAGLMAFCHANLVPGADMVLDAVGFDARAGNADLVITAEGRIDAQTEAGKAIAGVASRCRRLGVSVVALAGEVEGGATRRLGRDGVTAALSIASGPATRAELMRDVSTLLRTVARHATAIFVAGRAVGP